MPRLRANFTSSSWTSWKLSVCHGRTAPPARLFVSSGTTRSQSMPMVLPKPRHVGQAPMGELKEKRLAWGRCNGCRRRRSEGRRRSARRSSVVAVLLRGRCAVTRPWPYFSAASRSSISRPRFSALVGDPVLDHLEPVPLLSRGCACSPASRAGPSPPPRRSCRES